MVPKSSRRSRISSRATRPHSRAEPRSVLFGLVCRGLAGMPRYHRQAVDPLSLDGIDRQARCRDTLRRLPVRVTACPNPSPQGGSPCRTANLPAGLGAGRAPRRRASHLASGRAALRTERAEDLERCRASTSPAPCRSSRRQRQGLSTGLLEPNRPSECGCSLPRSPEHVGIRLDADVVHARRKVAPVGADAHAELKHSPRTPALRRPGATGARPCSRALWPSPNTQQRHGGRRSVCRHWRPMSCRWHLRWALSCSSSAEDLTRLASRRCRCYGYRAPEVRPPGSYRDSVRKEYTHRFQRDSPVPESRRRSPIRS